MDILFDCLIDTLKLVPFLSITFLLMEFLEHKASTEKRLLKIKKAGPFFGSILGAFPQCGFSVASTNLYATNIITLGTLISVYLSTSDEMLPILISKKTDFKLILFIILLKIIIGMTCGFIIDFIYKRKNNELIKDFCEEEHCDCEHGIIKSVLIHTIKIILFIFIINIVLSFTIENLPKENIENIFLKNSIFSPFLTSLLGLIPNCGSSIFLVELYLNNFINLSSLIGGLLTGCGIGLIVLFKTNKNLKENIIILFIIYSIGVFFGLLLNMLGI